MRLLLDQNLSPPLVHSLAVIVGGVALLVEHSYRQLKRELGLDHFEGRSWNGFHHHAVMTFLAYGFLTLERVRAESLPTDEPPPDEEDDPLGGAPLGLGG